MTGTPPEPSPRDRLKGVTTKTTAFEAALLIKPPALPGVSDFDVGRFQVAVDDALLMGRLKGYGDLFRDGEGFAEWYGALRGCGQPVWGLR